MAVIRRIPSSECNTIETLLTISGRRGPNSPEEIAGFPGIRARYRYDEASVDFRHGFRCRDTARRSRGRLDTGAAAFEQTAVAQHRAVHRWPGRRRGGRCE